MRLFLLIFGGVALTALVVLALMAMSFSRRIAAVERIVRAPQASGARDDLPEIVAAFARRGMVGALHPGAVVELTQAVEMRLKKGADWQPISARQVICAPIPGFAWVARMRAGPVTAVQVVDSYAAGRGLLEVRALGAIRMGREQGPTADRGEAMRYLAELPWSPDAMLSNPAVRWQVIAPDRVTATLDLGDGPASVTFVFDGAGDITGMRASGRPARDEQGAPVQMDWQGRFWDYGEIGGRRIPRRGEVGWIWPDGYQGYWRGQITGYAVH